MATDSLLATWYAEEAQPFTGWDFSYLDGRMWDEQTPWSYSNRAATLLDGASAVLDMDTGGGERFLALRPHWPAKVVATEEYPPNFALATARLSPHGAQVVDVRLTEDDPMPFAGGEFDLVLNRHAPFNAAEVARILAPGGSFLTQQVHGRSHFDLMAIFGAEPQWPDATPGRYVPRLQAAGLTVVDRQEWAGQVTFADVGAIVYYLKAAPWLVPGFRVATHLDGLLQLQQQVDAGRPLAFFAARYLIEARK